MSMHQSVLKNNIPFGSFVFSLRSVEIKKYVSAFVISIVLHSVIGFCLLFLFRSEAVVIALDGLHAARVTIVETKSSRPQAIQKPYEAAPIQSYATKTLPIQSVVNKESIAKPQPENIAAASQTNDLQTSANHSAVLQKSGSIEAAGANANSAVVTISRVYQPPYPALARIKKMQGEVQLLLSVNQQGNLQDIKITKSSGHSLLDEAAVAAAKKLRFKVSGFSFGQTLATKKLNYVFNLQSGTGVSGSPAE